MALMTSADSPAYRSPLYAIYSAMRTVVQDCLGGTDTLRAKAELYLPRAPAEKIVEWNRRVKRTEFFNGVRKTMRGLVGMVFRKNPRLGDDVPPAIVDHWENIDLRGNHGDVFSRGLFGAAMRDGFGGILVDYADVPDPGQLTMADTRAQEHRPFWCRVEADQILSWRTDYTPAGKKYLAQVVIEWCEQVKVGRFGSREKKTYKVFRNDGMMLFWETWEELTVPGQNGVAGFVMTGNGIVRGPTQIPLALCYTVDVLEEFEAQPPLLDLAHTNIAHFQVRSDHRHALHMGSHPILVMRGRMKAAGDSQEVGPNTGIEIGKDGDVFFAETTGAALAATRSELKDLEGNMAAMGLSMLQTETRAAETAESKRMDKGEQDSALATAARGLQDCLERALQFHAEYLGLTDGTIEVNQEFEHLTLEPAAVAGFSAMQTAGQLSLDTLWAILDGGNVLPDDFDPVAEKARILDELSKLQPPAPDPNAQPGDLVTDPVPVVDPTEGAPTPEPKAA